MLNSSYHRKNPFTSFLLQKELSSEICKHHQKCMDCENDKELCIPSIYKNSPYEMQMQARFKKCFIPHLSSIEKTFLLLTVFTPTWPRLLPSFPSLIWLPFLWSKGVAAFGPSSELRCLALWILRCRNSERKESEAHGILISFSFLHVESVHLHINTVHLCLQHHMMRFSPREASV